MYKKSSYYSTVAQMFNVLSFLREGSFMGKFLSAVEEEVSIMFHLMALCYGLVA